LVHCLRPDAKSTNKRPFLWEVRDQWYVARPVSSRRRRV